MWRSFFNQNSEIPCLYYIYDADQLNNAHLNDILKCVLAENIDVLQLRYKTGTPQNIFKLGVKIKEIINNRIPFIINDHVHIAKDINADGVHIGQDDMSAGEARSILGDEKIIGLTAFTRAQITAIDTDHVNYIGTGPVFETTTKKGKPVLGTEGLKPLVALSPVPVIGIGGITPDNARSVINAGAYGVAVMSGIGLSDDIQSTTRTYKKAIS